MTEKEISNFLLRETAERKSQEKFKEVFDKTYISNPFFNRSAMRQTNCLINTKVGKWLIFASTQSQLLEQWKIVAQATEEGKLGISAKVIAGEKKQQRSNLCLYL